MSSGEPLIWTVAGLIIIGGLGYFFPLKSILIKFVSELFIWAFVALSCLFTGYMVKHEGWTYIPSNVGELLYDLGFVLGPVVLIGLISNHFLKANYLIHLKDYIREQINPSIKSIEGLRKDEELREIIEKTQNKLFAIGVCPLDRQIEQQEWITTQFTKLKDVRLLILDPKSDGARMREEQSNQEAQIENEHTSYKTNLINVMKSKKLKKVVKLKEYT